MQKLLIFPDLFAGSIKEIYSKVCDKERILILYLRSRDGNILVDELVVPPEKEYKLCTKNSSSLKPQYLFENIARAVNEGYDGIMLIHNHNNVVPFFSRTDRQANKQFFHFFKQNNLDIIAVCAVYANSRVSYVTNRATLRDRYCIRI